MDHTHTKIYHSNEEMKEDEKRRQFFQNFGTRFRDSSLEDEIERRRFFQNFGR